MVMKKFKVKYFGNYKGKNDKGEDVISEMWRLYGKPLGVTHLGDEEIRDKYNMYDINGTVVLVGADDPERIVQKVVMIGDEIKISGERDKLFGDGGLVYVLERKLKVSLEEINENQLNPFARILQKLGEK